MKTKLPSFLIATLIWVWPSKAKAQTYDTNNVIVETFAGSGFYGYLDGIGQQTMFNNPVGIVADTSGNLFIWDSKNYRIRKITPDGTVSTFAGGGTQNTGNGTNVNLNNINLSAMAIDHNNTLWITEGSTVYKVTSDADVSATSLPGIGWPWGICFDSANNTYVTDYTGNRIYKMGTNDVLSVFVGSGNPGYADGNGVFTAFHYPAALAADAADNIYVYDGGNQVIRRIDQNQNVTTIAGQQGSSAMADGVGTNAAFTGVSTMWPDDSGNLILACFTCIRRITATANVTTIAGSFVEGGYTNGPGHLARFNAAYAACLARGQIFVADSSNQRIRSISFNPFAQTVLPANLQLSTYSGLQILGTVGRTYQIQSSTDNTQWTPATTLFLTSSPFLWIDQNPVNGTKFYRALLLP